MFWLLLSSAHRVSRLCLFPTLPPLLPQQGACGWEKWWEGTQAGQLTQMDQRDAPYPRTLCSAIKPVVGGQGFSSKGAVVEGVPGHQATCGTWWVIAFASSFIVSFTYQIVFILIHEFSCFCSSYSLIYPLREEVGWASQQLCGCWAAGRGQPTTAGWKKNTLGAQSLTNGVLRFEGMKHFFQAAYEGGGICAATDERSGKTGWESLGWLTLRRGG